MFRPEVAPEVLLVFGELVVAAMAVSVPVNVKHGVNEMDELAFHVTDGATMGNVPLGDLAADLVEEDVASVEGITVRNEETVAVVVNGKLDDEPSVALLTVDTGGVDVADTNADEEESTGFFVMDFTSVADADTVLVLEFIAADDGLGVSVSDVDADEEEVNDDCKEEVVTVLVLEGLELVDELHVTVGVDETNDVNVRVFDDVLVGVDVGVFMDDPVVLLVAAGVRVTVGIGVEDVVRVLVGVLVHLGVRVCVSVLVADLVGVGVGGCVAVLVGDRVGV